MLTLEWPNRAEALIAADIVEVEATFRLVLDSLKACCRTSYVAVTLRKRNRLILHARTSLSLQRC